MSFACFVFSIGKNVSYISLGTGPFALGTPLFTGGADSVEKPLDDDDDDDDDDDNGYFLSSNN